MMRSLVFLLVSIALPLSAAPVPTGDWTMHLYLGKKLFEDRVHIEKSRLGLAGKLTVPDRFTAPLEKIVITDKEISFEITADEGKGKFHVYYKGQFFPGTTTFTGFATVNGPSELLGGFVAQKDE